LKAPGIPAPLPPASVEKSKTKNKTKEPDDEQDSQILAEYRLGLSVAVSKSIIKRFVYFCRPRLSCRSFFL
jgi:hypothetical protein